MHEHGKIVLSDAQLAVYRQCEAALMKGATLANSHGNNAIETEHEIRQVGHINGDPIDGVVKTGRIKVCPGCLDAMPLVLRELADIYEELAKQLSLPEAKAKTKFGI